MRTYERLEALREWTYEKVCKGKMMKAPAKDMDVSNVVRQEPQVFLAWFPTRPDEHGYSAEGPMSAAPSILIMPCESYGKYIEVFRKANYDVHRPQEMGQSLRCQLLFTVFEDGVRMPGFVDSAKSGKFDMSLIKEGTQDGLHTLLDWMDEFKEALLGQKVLPGTDLSLSEASMTYGLYQNGEYVADKRPIYYGIVEVAFTCHADEKPNRDIARLLD